MKSIKPLREGSDDLAHIVEAILRHDPWNVSLVEKALHCYRAWANYAVHEEDVKFEVLFPYMVLFYVLTTVIWEIYLRQTLESFSLILALSGLLQRSSVTSQNGLLSRDWL